MEKRSCKSCGINESEPFKVVGSDSFCIGCRPDSSYNDLEPDSICPDCKIGELYDSRDGNCYCSTTSMPPCCHCTTLQLNCNECDFEVGESY